MSVKVDNFIHEFADERSERLWYLPTQVDALWCERLRKFLAEELVAHISAVYCTPFTAYQRERQNGDSGTSRTSRMAERNFCIYSQIPAHQPSCGQNRKTVSIVHLLSKFHGRKLIRIGVCASRIGGVFEMVRLQWIMRFSSFLIHSSFRFHSCILLSSDGFESDGFAYSGDCLNCTERTMFWWRLVSNNTYDQCSSFSLKEQEEKCF